MIYSIAGITVELNFKYEYGRKKCERYLSEGIPSISLSASDKEIENELSLFPQNTEGTAEFDCIFRKLYNIAPSFDKILIHGAAIMKNGKGFLFVAPSGTGKTTHIKRWGKRFGNEVVIIDGDKPFVGFENNVPTVWGSPRSGKEGWNNPISAPLVGIALLERNDTNSITPVSPTEIFDNLFMQFYFPPKDDAARLTTQIINRILENVPLYRLRCNMETEAAEVAFSEMNK